PTRRSSDLPAALLLNHDGNISLDLAAARHGAQAKTPVGRKAEVNAAGSGVQFPETAWRGIAVNREASGARHRREAVTGALDGNRAATGLGVDARIRPRDRTRS